MTAPDYSDASARADTHARIDVLLNGAPIGGSLSGLTCRYLRIDAEYRWPVDHVEVLARA